MWYFCFLSLLNFNEYKVFLLFSMFKLEINSYGNLKKEVSVKNNFKLSQVNPQVEPSLRKFD